MDNGGPAFPRLKKLIAPATASTPDFTAESTEGMSLRDWFAGMALAAMTAAPDYSKGPCNAAMAERAFIIADAMLAERSKEK